MNYEDSRRRSRSSTTAPPWSSPWRCSWPAARPGRPRPVRRGGGDRAPAQRDAVADHGDGEPPGALRAGPEDRARGHAPLASPGGSAAAACSSSSPTCSPISTPCTTASTACGSRGTRSWSCRCSTATRPSCRSTAPRSSAISKGTKSCSPEPGAFRLAYRRAMIEFLDGVSKECGARGYDHVRFFTDTRSSVSLELVPACAGRSGRNRRASLNHVHILDSTAALGHAAGRHPHHHPPAEPPAVPPGGVGYRCAT